MIVPNVKVEFMVDCVFAVLSASGLGDSQDMHFTALFSFQTKHSLQVHLSFGLENLSPHELEENEVTAGSFFVSGSEVLLVSNLISDEVAFNSNGFDVSIVLVVVNFDPNSWPFSFDGSTLGFIISVNGLSELIKLAEMFSLETIPAKSPSPNNRGASTVFLGSAVVNNVGKASRFVFTTPNLNPEFHIPTCWELWQTLMKCSFEQICSLMISLPVYFQQFPCLTAVVWGQFLWPNLVVK